MENEKKAARRSAQMRVARLSLLTGSTLLCKRQAFIDHRRRKIWPV